VKFSQWTVPKKGLSGVSKDYRARISVGFSKFVSELRHIPPGALFPYLEHGTGAHPSVSFHRKRATRHVSD
jgi:hypothetical protein